MLEENKNINDKNYNKVFYSKGLNIETKCEINKVYLKHWLFKNIVRSC